MWPLGKGRDRLILLERKRILVIVIDYCSNYPEIAVHVLHNISLKSVITHIQSMFARHGILKFVVSDNRPQYAAESFADFAEKLWFQTYHL